MGFRGKSRATQRSHSTRTPSSVPKLHLQIVVFHFQSISLLAYFPLQLLTPHSEHEDKHTEELAEQHQIA